jgi:predicted nucleotidyltransferase component of viral defense system
VLTYDIHELLGTKLRALFQRKKGRDLFDLWYVAQHQAIDGAKVIECFLRYTLTAPRDHGISTTDIRPSEHAAELGN